LLSAVGASGRGRPLLDSLVRRACGEPAFFESAGLACYANVMSIKRITISVPTDVARRIKKAARGTPVSAWVTDVVEERLNDAELDRQWEQFYRDVGPSKRDERQAEAVFKRLTKRNGRRGVA
jgi:hypothetical protein